MTRSKTTVTELDYLEEIGLAGLHPGIWKKLPYNAECVVAGILLNLLSQGYREQAEPTTLCTEQGLN